MNNVGSFLKKAGTSLINPSYGMRQVGKAASKVHDFLSPALYGTPEERENVSTLRPEQEALYQQAVNAGLNKGAGGAFGDAADYYRGLLSNENEDYNAFSAPMLRQYNQDIVPGLSEQFAGMGAGGLSSSGFRNAQMQGATDLAERLGAIRANLRQAGAQGLQNIGQQGLQNYSQNMVTNPGQEGLVSQLPGLAVNAASAYFGVPPVGQGEVANSLFKNTFGGNKGVGANTSPYGQGQPTASPQIGPSRQLPNFLQGTGRGF